MTILQTDSESATTLVLQGVAGLRDAVAFRGALVECLQTHRSTILDLEGLEGADTAALQVVAAAQRSFAEAQVPFVLRDGGKTVFQDTCRAAGLDILAAEVKL
jgi:hypothetical protein